MASSPDSKRQRTASSPNNNGSTLSIVNLPHDHLTSILDYLPKTSVALFALALRGEHDEVSEAVISLSTNEYWDTLDFADIGDLAARLTDEHIRSLLLVIDANNNLKKLRLTGCTNFVGHGLEPLRESVVLEHICIDLSLERMSTVVVTPILDSIIETEGNSLREMEIHNIHHAENDSSLRKFLVKFNTLLSFGDKNCSSCEEENNRRVRRGEEQITVQPASNTCFQCFRRTCDDCNEDGISWLQTCDHCELTFCNYHGTECHGCHGTFHCPSCTRDNHVDSAVKCDRSSCYDPFCLECSIRIDGSGCEKCDGLHFPALVKKYKEKDNENKLLRNENGQVTEENKQLREEIEELRKKMSSGLGILA